MVERHGSAGVRRRAASRRRRLNPRVKPAGDPAARSDWKWSRRLRPGHPGRNELSNRAWERQDTSPSLPFRLLALLLLRLLLRRRLLLLLLL
jgi:hypothetical protein